MIRTFQEHSVRKQTELSGKLWDVIPLEGDLAKQKLHLMVPGCWENYPGMENYRGKAEYTAEFYAEGDIRLVFKGVSHMAWVYVDGEEIGTHYNSYTSFEFVVRGLKRGTHVLKVLVDNSFRPEYALNRPNDYMSYGGISRAVILEEIPEVYLHHVHVTPLREGPAGWKARVEITTENILEVEQNIVIDMDVGQTRIRTEELIAKPGRHVVWQQEIDVEGVDSWTPENPALYEIRLRLTQGGKVLDDLTDRTGFRKIEINENRILLNGKALRIKGINRHEDHPQYGCALPFEAMCHDLYLIRDMGCNSIRTAHYPNNEIFLDLCDELGILVWEEHHLRGSNEQMMRNPCFEPQCEQVIEEMITQHYNHPGIYIWGIMNECASDTEYGRMCYNQQYMLIRSLDRSRPCGSASNKYETDLCLDLPDVVAWNMYPYWYESRTADKMVDDLYGWTQTDGKGKGKPFLITEIGAGAIYGFRSPDHDPWTEEYQREVLEKQLREVMAHEECMGLYIWQFCDIRVNKEWFEKRPRTRNNKGIVDEFRRRKLAYASVKRIFGSCRNYWE